MNSKTNNPHLTLTLSPPIGWERRGDSQRASVVVANPTALDRLSDSELWF